jgi:hypothetical protein
VRGIAFSPDDQMILAALPAGVRAWDLRDGSSRDLLRLRGGADTVSFSSADEAYVSADGGALIYRVRIPDGEILEQWKGKRAEGPIAISPGGRHLAAATATGVIKLHDLNEGGKPRRIEVGEPVTSLDWATGGRWLVAGTEAGAVHIYEIEADSLPMGFQETPRLRGRGGGVQGSWAGEPSRSAGRVDRDDRNDRGVRRTNEDDTLRLDLEMGRDTGSRLGDGSGRTKSGGPARLPAPRAMVEIEVRPRVIVLDQMGGDPRNGRNLEASLNKNRKRLKRCWRLAQRAGDPILGTIVFDLGISPNGEGVGIEPPVEDSIGSAKLVECLESRLREALFGPGLGSMDVRLTLEFVEAR